MIPLICKESDPLRGSDSPSLTKHSAESPVSTLFLSFPHPIYELSTLARILRKISASFGSYIKNCGSRSRARIWSTVNVTFRTSSSGRPPPTPQGSSSAFILPSSFIISGPLTPQESSSVFPLPSSFFISGRAPPTPQRSSSAFLLPSSFPVPSPPYPAAEKMPGTDGRPASPHPLSKRSGRSSPV